LYRRVYPAILLTAGQYTLALSAVEGTLLSHLGSQSVLKSRTRCVL